MVKSESLQYAGHGHRTGPGISITNLDSNTATIRQSNRIDRFGPSLGNETRNGTMQFQLVTPSARFPLTSTFAELATAAGVEARHLRDVYPVGPELHEEDAVQVDPDAVTTILDAFVRGDAALRQLSPGSDPVLWPEHFDVGIAADDVNYGVSPGDVHFASPYAYVGPWQPRVGDFWNTAFGAARPMTQLPDVETLVRFFREGAEHARLDPPRRP